MPVCNGLRLYKWVYCTLLLIKYSWESLGPQCFGGSWTFLGESQGPSPDCPKDRVFIRHIELIRGCYGLSLRRSVFVRMGYSHLSSELCLSSRAAFAGVEFRLRLSAHLRQRQDGKAVFLLHVFI